MKQMLLILAALATAGALNPSQAGPSFPCSKAKAPDEKAICGSEQLSNLDTLVNDGFGRLVSALGRANAKKVNAPFLRQRQLCRDDVNCIAAVYGQEIAVLRIMDPTLGAGMEAPKPTDYDTLKRQLNIGECTVSVVTMLGPRLCNADASGNCPENLPFDDSGDSIGAGNGLYGVDYDRIRALEESKVGDKVLLCLKSKPKHCPKDDDRGYAWTWQNLRTNRSWTMFDSQHMCGGA